MPIWYSINIMFILATKPQVKSAAGKSKKSKEAEFKTAADGRLIITEDSSDEG